MLKLAGAARAQGGRHLQTLLIKVQPPSEMSILSWKTKVLTEKLTSHCPGAQSPPGLHKENCPGVSGAVLLEFAEGHSEIGGR